MTEPVVVDDRHDAGDRGAIQKRTLIVLFAGTVFSRAGMASAFAVAALLIQDILGDGTWAGASTAAVTVGMAISASRLNSYMSRRGRRPGLTLGFVIAVIGAGVAAFGGQRLLLVVYLLGIVMIGVGQGATNLARYAAADLALPDQRGKAISLIVFASTIGAVGGPALVGPAGRVASAFDLNELVGPFLFGTVFFGVAGLILWTGLRPDPLVVAGGLRRSDGSQGSRSGFGEGLAAIAASPMAVLATVALVISQAVMVMVMAMTPLHMDAHGHGLGTIGWVISAHTAGMFGFAPLAGWASDRYGRLPILAAGGAMLMVSTVMTALAGEAPALLMFPGLYLLGLGWSFGMVGASTLLTESVEAEHQVVAQGSADLVTSFTAGAGAIASGVVFTMAGFHVLSMIGILASGAMLVASFHRLRLTATEAALSK